MRAVTRVACRSALVIVLLGRPVNADLVGFWSFDDETADDLSGNDNHGVESGVFYSDDVPDGMTGMSLEVVNGTNVTVPHSDSLDLVDTMSIAFWIKADNSLQTDNWNGPLSKSANEPRQGWEFQRWESQSRLDLRIDTDAGENSVRGNVTGTYDDEWVHVAWVVDEGFWASYRNGELVEEGAYPHGSGFGNEQANLLFGCRAGPWCVFTGLLDEIGIWDSVLTEDEIASLADGVSPVDPGAGPVGDFNGNRVLDLPDIDLLTGESATGNHPEAYDLTGDGQVNEADVTYWVSELFGSYQGDMNLDLVFTSADLVSMLALGTYESDQPTTWSAGDFNGDGRTNSGDLVTALAGGGYEQGPRQATAAVPEPATAVLLLIGSIAMLRCSVMRRGAESAAGRRRSA
jgi:hypothetical protein